MTTRSPITTHILDTRTGLPAEGMKVELEAMMHLQWKPLASGVTDVGGRIIDLLPSDYSLSVGKYRMIFETGTYHTAQDVDHFYPLVTIEFEIQSAADHYHIPLLISPFGYSTYRGS